MNELKETLADIGLVMAMAGFLWLFLTIIGAI